MKITCQSCQAKYTIADEKVAGKTVKIKCKKCGATIVVNGSETGSVGPIAGPAPAAAAAGGGGDEDDNDGATRVFAEGGGPGGSEWTVNVTDEDQRTLTSPQLVIEYQRGVIHADTYVWKDGMADWSPVSGVPELMALIGSTAPAAPVPAAGRPAPQPEPAGGLGGTMMMNDGAAPTPFAAAPAPQMAAPQMAAPAQVATPAPAAARRKAPAAGVDLFAPGQQPEGGAAAASSATTSADRLVGERNENSVLFSISALTAAAGVKRGDDPFDLGPAPTGRNGGRSSGGASVDDIMNLGGGMSQGPVLAPPPLLAPVVEPPPPPAPVIAMQPMNLGAGMGEYPQKKKPIGLIVGILVGVFGLGGGAFFALSGGGDKKTGAETTTTAATAATTAPVATTAAAPTQAPADTGNAAQPPSTGAPTTTGAPTQGPVASNPGKTDPKPGPGPGRTDPKPDTKPDTKPDPKPDTKPDPKPDEKKAPDTSSGKEFDRAAASSALGGAAGGAKGCKTADGPTGSGKVKVTFAPSGNVTSVTLESGPFAGTPLAGCIIGAFRGAHIPPFDGSPVSVGKSFSIN